MNTRCPAGLTALLLASTLATGTVQAQTDPLDSILSCRDIADANARLACFDAAAAGLGDARDSGDIVAVSRESVEAVERDAFGFSLPSLPSLNLGLGRGTNALENTASESSAAEAGIEVVGRNDDGSIDAIRMEIADIRPLGRSEHLFTMTNGQVWRQVGGGRLPGNVRGGGHTVEIRTGTLGNYLMYINDLNRAVRVRRVE